MTETLEFFDCSEQLAKCFAHCKQHLPESYYKALAPEFESVERGLTKDGGYMVGFGDKLKILFELVDFDLRIELTVREGGSKTIYEKIFKYDDVQA